MFNIYIEDNQTTHLYQHLYDKYMLLLIFHKKIIFQTLNIPQKKKKKKKNFQKNTLYKCS